MPNLLPKAELLSRVVDAVHASGWGCVVLSNTHPFSLSLVQGDVSHKIICYVWNMTHGGYPRDPDELRIQVTGIDRFSFEPEGKTLVLGWSEDLRVFVGFDARKHLIPMSGRSPSLQVRRETLTAATTRAFSTQNRGNGEIAIAFRAAFFATYVQELEPLHEAAGSLEDLKEICKIAEEPIDRRVADIPPGPRQVVLQQVQRKVRNQRFRFNVLSAYDFRCAMSGIQLNLLDAAHVIPVEHEKGTDETKNGICLSAIHHRAFDQGLVGIRSDYSVVVNERRLGELKRLGWDGGIDLFKATLRDQILLPARRQHYPDPEYLAFGQSLRGWNRRLIEG